ncbi:MULTISPECIES: hypothetical protein [Corallococcus]|uniref:Uncharacterized protein n=2 Tax=Corallococcus TaxID=83461 RepID=A0A7Y4NEC5_9BACT|nr:hypothetical protein [Corallococcus exercitus]NOK10809.1 hypothetical protein [Corallococcus exercitus]GMU10566.1 hypothetical protein ASNO1_68200 [Corallococcus sp. NO1]
MARREQAREEAAFARGDVGVDGVATEEEKDEAEVEKGKAREQLLRGRAYLGREFMTWLLWRSESGDPLVEFDGAGVVVLFLGKVVLRGVAGDVTEMSAKGTLAPYSENVRHSLDRGLLVSQARLRISHGEREYEVTLDSEFLDIRAAKLPALMTEEEDDQLTERLELTEQLSGLVDALVQDFLPMRAGRAWSKQVVPAMKAWMKGEEKGSDVLSKAARARGRDARAARG